MCINIYTLYKNLLKIIYKFQKNDTIMPVLKRGEKMEKEVVNNNKTKITDSNDTSKFE